MAEFEGQQSARAFLLRRYKMTSREGVQTAGVPLPQLGVHIHQMSNKKQKIKKRLLTKLHVQDRNDPESTCNILYCQSNDTASIYMNN